MPELIEVELYRAAAEEVVGRRITEVSTPDPAYVKGGADPLSLRLALIGATVLAARRHGKLLLLDMGSGESGESGDSGSTTVGLHFGMTGRLVVDGTAPIARLEYSSGRDLPAWTRFGLGFEHGGDLRISDPRRLGGVTLDPDLAHLGPDALALGERELSAVLSRSRRPLKARLLDQSAIAGIGNLICDETLWQARLAPTRRADSLGRVEVRTLRTTLRRVVTRLTRRGGSHTGQLQDHRRPGGSCPRCGNPLSHASVGGRSTWWCPSEQV